MLGRGRRQLVFIIIKYCWVTMLLERKFWGPGGGRGVILG